MRKAFSVSVFLINRETNCVLLVHHKRFGLWLPVGGEIEPGESPLEAAVREVQEETGFMGLLHFPEVMKCPGAVPGMFAFEQHEAGEKGLHMNFCFLAFTSEKEVKLCEEHSDWEWFPLTRRRDDDFRNQTTLNVLWCMNEVDNILGR